VLSLRYGVRGSWPSAGVAVRMRVEVAEDQSGQFSSSGVLRPSAKEPRNNFQQIAQTYCDLQAKFVAKFVSPVPVYTATCG